MTITIRAIGTLMASTSNDQAVGLPSGHVTDDLLMLLGGTQISGGATLTATGYTSRASHSYAAAAMSAAVLTKADGGSESAPALHSNVTTANGIVGVILGVIGVDATTPLDGVTPLWTDMGSVTTDSGPPSGVTNATAGALAVCCIYYSNDSRWGFKVGSDQGFTLDTTPASSFSSTIGTDMGLLICHKEISGSGSLITFPSFAPTQASPSSGTAATFVLKPAASAAGGSARRRMANVPHAYGARRFGGPR